MLTMYLWVILQLCCDRLTWAAWSIALRRGPRYHPKIIWQLQRNVINLARKDISWSVIAAHFIGKRERADRFVRMVWNCILCVYVSANFGLRLGHLGLCASCAMSAQAGNLQPATKIATVCKWLNFAKESFRWAGRCMKRRNFNHFTINGKCNERGVTATIVPHQIQEVYNIQK